MIVRCACGVPIIGYRTCWATPTCVGCLPPPDPLPIAAWPSPKLVVEISASKDYGVRIVETPPNLATIERLSREPAD